MKFIDKVMSIYKKELFTRKEENDSIFYFRHTDFEGLNATPYSFESVKGHKLNGYFYYYDNPKKNRLIVFDHGMGAGHYSYLREIETLAKHGYLVFSYDHTGCVDSEGENIGGFCQSLVDLNDAIASLKTIKELKDYKISVMGHSWGGYSTLNIASLHKDLASVIAISGYISVSDMIAQTFKFPMNFIRKYAYRLEQQNNPYFIEANAIDSLSSFEGKALIMHSKGDKLVDYNRHFKKLQRALHKKENIKFTQHTAAGVSDVDAKGTHEGVNLLRYLQKSNGTEEPDEYVSRYFFFALSRHLGLYFAFRHGKNRNRAKAEHHQDGQGDYQYLFHTHTSHKQGIGQECAHHGSKQAQAPCVHDKQEHLPGEHTAPALENVPSRLSRSGCECHWCREHKHTEEHIPFCCFKEELDIVPSQDEQKDQSDQRNGSVCYNTEDRHNNGVEVGEGKRRQIGGQDPVIWCPADLQGNIYDIIGKDCKEDEQHTADGELDRIFRFQSRHKSEVLEDIPDPVEQDQSDSQCNKDAVHGFRCRKIPQEGVHIASQRTENGCGNHVKQVHDLFGDPLHDFI